MAQKADDITNMSTVQVSLLYTVNARKIGYGLTHGSDLFQLTTADWARIYKEEFYS